MSPQEILKEALKDPVFVEKYGLTNEKIKGIELHKHINNQIIEIVKIIILANANNATEINTYKQIKQYLGLI
jgi:hypothetical protein